MLGNYFYNVLKLSFKQPKRKSIKILLDAEIWYIYDLEMMRLRWNNFAYIIYMDKLHVIACENHSTQLSFSTAIGYQLTSIIPTISQVDC